MISFIISIISILLVAILAMASILYTQNALNRGSAMARATESINQGTQILSAMDLHKVDFGVYPDSLEELVIKGYLKEVPSLKLAKNTNFMSEVLAQRPQRQWTIPLPGVPLAWTESVVDESFSEICKAVNYKARNYDGILKRIQATPETQCYGPSTSNLKIVVSRTQEAIEEVTQKDPEIFDNRKVPPEVVDEDWLLRPDRFNRPILKQNTTAEPDSIEGELVSQGTSVYFGKASQLPSKRTLLLKAKDGPASYESITLSGDGYSLLETGTCPLYPLYNFRLEKDQSCTVDVLLNAPSLGTYSGQITVSRGGSIPALSIPLWAEKTSPSPLVVSSSAQSNNFDYGLKTTNLIGYSGQASQESPGLRLFVRGASAGASYKYTLLEEAGNTGWLFEVAGKCDPSRCTSSYLNNKEATVTTDNSSRIPFVRLKPPSVSEPGTTLFSTKVRVQALNGSLDEVVEVYHQYTFDFELNGLRRGPLQSSLFPQYNAQWAKPWGFSEGNTIALPFVAANSDIWLSPTEGTVMGFTNQIPVYFVPQGNFGGLKGTFEINGPDKDYFKIAQVSKGSPNRMSGGAALMYKQPTGYAADVLPSTANYPQYVLGSLIAFSPLEPRAYNATLKFKPADKLPLRELEFNLKGQGLYSIPAEFKFLNPSIPPKIAPNLELQFNSTLYNGYNFSIRELSYELTGPDASFFEITSSCSSLAPFSHEFPGRSSCRLGLRFKGSLEKRFYNAELIARASNAANFIARTNIEVEVTDPIALKHLVYNANVGNTKINTTKTGYIQYSTKFNGSTYPSITKIGLDFRVISPNNNTKIQSVRLLSSNSLYSKLCPQLIISEDGKSTTGGCYTENSYPYIRVTYTVSSPSTGTLNDSIEAIAAPGNTSIRPGDEIQTIRGTFVP